MPGGARARPGRLTREVAGDEDVDAFDDQPNWGLADGSLPTGAAAAMLPGMETYVLPVLLGLGLASATGLKTFLPLTMLSAAARFDWFGISLNQHVGWLGSDVALIALAVATVIELAADKIPIVDHALSAVGTFARPAAGALATYAVLGQADPTVAAVAALIVGAPAALAVHTAQSGTRVASTATTGGLANPVVSFIEDVLAFVTVLIAFVAPLLVPLVLVLLFWLVWRLVKAARRTLRGPAAPPPTAT